MCATTHPPTHDTKILKKQVGMQWPPCLFASLPLAIKNSIWLKESASADFLCMICHAISGLACAWAISNIIIILDPVSDIYTCEQISAKKMVKIISTQGNSG